MLFLCSMHLQSARRDIRQLRVFITFLINLFPKYRFCSISYSATTKVVYFPHRGRVQFCPSKRWPVFPISLKVDKYFFFVPKDAKCSKTYAKTIFRFFLCLMVLILSFQQGSMGQDGMPLTLIIFISENIHYSIFVKFLKLMP